MKNFAKIAIVVLIIVGTVWWSLSSAIDCGNKGGRYVPGGKDQWPMCVKEVK